MSCIIVVIQSELVVYHAEQVIDSELQRVELSHDDGAGDAYPFQLWLWVYETDMQARKTVYRSDMIWPNKQHEDVYICIGMTGRESDDERCLSDDMTVIFTENHSKGHRKAANRTQIKLPFTKINQFLPEEEAETRAKICNSACARKRTGIIVGSIFGSIFGLAFLFMLCICLPSCCSGAKSNSNGSGASRNPVHGKDIPCPHSTIIQKYSGCIDCESSIKLVQGSATRLSPLYHSPEIRRILHPAIDKSVEVAFWGPNTKDCSLYFC